jgi:hypothetical protein
MRSGESLVPMTTDQIQQIIEEEMSPLAKRILYMIGVIVAIVVIRVGMSRKEVLRLLGEAEKVRVSSDFEYWEYGSGEIAFYQGALESWTEPDK